MSNPRLKLEDDLDTSTPLMTPTDAESAVMAGRPYPPPRTSALILTALLVGFMLVVFAAATFFIYNGKQNGLTAAFPESSPTPVAPPGSERVQIPNISAAPVVSSENVIVQVTVTPVPSTTPLPGTTPQPPMNVTVTNYYTGANLTLTITDKLNLLPTHAPQIVGPGTPAVPTPAIAPMQSVILKIVFFNNDNSVAGSWVANVGPIPLGGSNDFTIAIPTKPGLGKWDGKGQIIATVYAIVTGAGK